MPVTKQNARKKLNASSDKKKRQLITLNVALAVVILDFFLKWYLSANFAYQSISLIDNFLKITVIFNTGTAFGFFPGQTNILVYLTIAVMFVFFLLFRSEKDKKFAFLVGAGLIFGGAISNLIDRIIWGAVVDYIDFGFWPVFNISDACITVGAFLLIIDSLKKRQKKSTGAKEC